MGELTKLDQIRREERRRQVKRRLRLFSLCILGVSAVILVRAIQTGAQPIGFVTDVIAANRNGEGYPADWGGGVIEEMYRMGSSLAALGENHLVLYNPNGRPVVRVTHGFGHPIAMQKGRYLMTFDRGGKGLRLDTLTGEEAAQRMEEQIIVAALAKNGGVCVATTSPDYLGQVTVLGRDLERNLFTWRTAEMYINCVAISDDSDYIGVAGLNGEGGQLISYLYLYRVSGQDDKPEGRISLPGEIILSCVFNQKGQLQVITDKQVLLAATDGRIIRSVDMEGVPLARFVNDPAGRVFLLQGDYRDRSGYRLVSLGNELQKESRMDLPVQVEGMKAEGGKLYLLCDRRLMVYNDDLEAIGEMADFSGYLFQPAGRYVFGLENGSIARRSLTGGREGRYDE